VNDTQLQPVAFRFADERWLRIARELGPKAEEARGGLEMWAGELLWFRQRRVEWSEFSPTEEAKRLLRIGSLVDDLLSEVRQSELYGVNFASRVIGGWTSPDDDVDDERDVDCQLAEFETKWESFLSCLGALREDCVKNAKRPRPRMPANVDEDRNGVWAAVAEIYQNTTGDEPSAYVGSPGSKSQGIAGGQFVRFVQAWMASIPGENEPKPDEVRWFVRRRLPELKWW
jgi:hypothetical protein